MSEEYKPLKQNHEKEGGREADEEMDKLTVEEMVDR